MGERLVFNCVKGGKRIATIYYHWSGYTQSIYWEAAELVKWLRNHGYTGKENAETIQRLLLVYLEERGGGVSGDGFEIEEWKKRGVNPKIDGVSRNNGLLDITERGIKNAEYWAEALEEFNFDDETFGNHEYYHEPKSELELEHPEKVPAWNPNPRYVDTIKWDDASDALNWFNSLPRYEWVLGVDSDGNYVTALE